MQKKTSQAADRPVRCLIFCGQEEWLAFEHQRGPVHGAGRMIRPLRLVSSGWHN